MPRFKPYNHDQNAMVVINYQDQLHPGTFEHAVHYLIEHKLDLSVFHLPSIATMRPVGWPIIQISCLRLSCLPTRKASPQ